VTKRPHIKLLTEEEIARRARQRKKPTYVDPRLRYPRAYSAHLLSKSVASIQRMEKRGLLTVLRDTPKGAVFHPAGQVRKLAGDVQADEAVR
jgi:hypothetical protein